LQSKAETQVVGCWWRMSARGPSFSCWEQLTGSAVLQRAPCAVEADSFALPHSILERDPERRELGRIRIPALRCFGSCVNSRLDGFWALGCNRFDQRLLVGSVCLGSFERADQIRMGKVLVHGGLLFVKQAIFGENRGHLLNSFQMATRIAHRPSPITSTRYKRHSVSG